jgi:hypothetical protein
MSIFRNTIISPRRSLATSFVVSLMLAAVWAPASAQVADPCATIDSKLTGLADTLIEFKKAKEDFAKNNPDPAKAATPPPDPMSFALQAITKQPSPLRVDISSHNLPGDGQAWFAIVGAPYSDDKANVCVRIYLRPVISPTLNADGTVDETKSPKLPFRQLNIQQSFRFLDPLEDNLPKYKIVFDVPGPPGPASFSNWFTKNYEFLVVAATGSNFLNYRTEEAITRKAPGIAVALTFVVVCYLLLAWATYSAEDMGGLNGIRNAVYRISPMRITAGVSGDSSISQLQVVLFTFIVASLLLYLWMRTGLLVSISKDLLYLLGISAVGAGAAKFTATLKSDLNAATKDYIVGKGWYNWAPMPTSMNANLANLFLTSGRLDVYKLQVAIFTIVVAAYVVSSGQNDLGDVKISDTMLYLIGISQGVYIGGKAITDRTTRIEDAISKMKQAEGDPAKAAEFEAAQKTAKNEFAELYQLVQV